TSHSFMREIPQCWLTGHAAGAAAAVAANRRVSPRAVDVGEIQAALLKQGAYLRPAISAASKRDGTGGRRAGRDWLIGANIGSSTSLLTLRRPPGAQRTGGRLEGGNRRGGSFERSSRCRSGSHPSRRSLRSLLRVRSGVE